MDSHLFIALTGGLINAALSSAVPCLINKSDVPLLMEMRKVYETNRQTIISSSLVIVITIYLALKLAPSLRPMLSNLASLGSDDYNVPIVFSPQSIGLKNLVRLG